MGTGISHREWTGQLSVPNTNDVGVVVLSEPVTDIAPALVAPLGFVDELLEQRGTKDLQTLPEGCGLQESWPPQSNKPQEPWDLARWWGE